MTSELHARFNKFIKNFPQKFALLPSKMTYDPAEPLALFQIFGLQKLVTLWPHHTAARGILVPQPGIKPAPPQLEAGRLNHWMAREVPPYWSL